MTEIVTRRECTKVLPERSINQHPYLANTPPSIQALSLLVQHYGQLTGKSLFVLHDEKVSGEIEVYQYGCDRPIYSYLSVEMAIKHIQSAIDVFLDCDRVINKPVAIDTPDWIEELEAFENDVEVWGWA